LTVSNIPFEKPIASVKVGRINGQFIINPTLSQQAESDLDLVVSGTDDAFTMVEAGAGELSEAEMLEALNLAKEEIGKICAFIRTFPSKEKIAVSEPVLDAAMKADVEAEAVAKAEECVFIKDQSGKRFCMGFV
jgi:polyribonucleotide nucleotidyltransferase